MQDAGPDLHVAIVSWDGMFPAAHKIATALEIVGGPVTTIYSNASGQPETGPGRWIGVPQSDYFGRKLARLLDNVAPDQAMLLIQADARCDDWPGLVRRCKAVLARDPGIGIWSPKIDNTAFPTMLASLGRRSDDGLIEVMQTDAIVLGIVPSVVDRLRTLDFGANNLGWGVDWAAICAARTRNLVAVSDVSVKVAHPKSRGYETAQAEQGMRAFLDQLTPEERVIKESYNARLAARIAQNSSFFHPVHSPFQGAAMTDTDCGFLNGLLSHVRFLHLVPGQLCISPIETGAEVWVSAGGERVSSPAMALDAVPKILPLAPPPSERYFVKDVTGEEWSCPGQATTSIIVPSQDAQMKIPLIEEMDVPRDWGDLTLVMGIAVHRATADILVEWQDAQDPGKSFESYINFDPKFNGRNEVGTYKAVRVRIPAIGGNRKLKITLCYWNSASQTGEPAVMLMSRPVLFSTAEAEGVATPLTVIGAQDNAANAPRLALTITAATDPLMLHIGSQVIPLLGDAGLQPSIFERASALYARCSAPVAVTLCLNGRALRSLWVGPEEVALDLPPGVLADSNSVVDLRDPSGNLILARYGAAPQVNPQTPIANATGRHPDAWSIDALFDADFYLAGFPPQDQPADPASHYLETGWKQGRDPTPWFSSVHYLSLHPDIDAAGMNPFLHYCIAGKSEGRALQRLGQKSDGDVYKAHHYAVNPGPHFEEFDPNIGVGRRKRAKVIAYYLPQFHPVEVNDTQWGKGFTEWRNLPRALPRFMGHIQPRIPRDLGCYDLVEGDVMRRQIDMARAAGLFGFCFYHYWFDGARVLEKPIERFLADPTLDFPFCIMWANENWTRTWDGSEKEIILGQTYRREDDIPFLDDVARHMKDPRYIRLNDRPLFFIYRPGHIPDNINRLREWRQIFKDRHGLEPIIMQAQSFGDNDPRPFDLDGAIEFPPHKVLNHAPDQKHLIDLFDPDFSGSIPTYESVIKAAKVDAKAEFPLIRTIFPSWDNDARRPGRSTIVSNSTPDLFAEWLDWAMGYAEENPVFGEKIICINAWNEWAEGAYLEPDAHFGAAYLNTLSRVIHSTEKKTQKAEKKLLLVGHDAMSFGAQILLRNIGEELVQRSGLEVKYLLISEGWKPGVKGPLLAAYQRLGDVHLIPPDDVGLDSFLAECRANGFDAAITNTTVAGAYLPALKKFGYRVISLVHELPNLIQSYGLHGQAAKISQLADQVIFPASIVRDGYETVAGKVVHEAVNLPQGLYKTSVLDTIKSDNGVRAEFGLASHTKIVLNVGYADLRKGIDRFVSTALSVCSIDENVAFLWIGAPAGETSAWYQPEIDASGLDHRIRILGHREDVARFFAAADLFYLSSREDPFPSVVLEALASGLPVVGHEGCGGCDDLIRKHGTLVPRGQPHSTAEAILAHLTTPEPKYSPATLARRREIAENYRFDSYVFDLAKRALPGLVDVSVIVPNYNYEHYIGERLRSVFDQTAPLREVIVLDDASGDNSLAQIDMTARAAGRRIALHVNRTNSGSVFRQWRKGVERAKGDYIWIAEADDLADPSFVAALTDRMRATDSALGFTDSRQIDETGATMGDSYRPYLNQIEEGQFDTAFDMPGSEFLSRFLSVKNVILNVSGVIFRKEALLAAFDAVGEDLYDFKVAGDWRLYAEICAAGGRVTYLPQPLNTHRRHSISVTHALKVEKHLAEIQQMHRFCAGRVGLKQDVVAQQSEHFEKCREHLLQKVKAD